LLLTWEFITRYARIIKEQKKEPDVANTVKRTSGSAGSSAGHHENVQKETAMTSVSIAERNLEEDIVRRGLSADDRKQHRHAFAGRVACGDAHQTEFAALDLSGGGIGVLSSRRLTAGQSVKLSLLEGSISVEGYVAHARALGEHDWRLGISFLEDQTELLAVALVM
jgi:hypothetical protein